jgi:addiction module RelE/StbE family toxin
MTVDIIIPLRYHYNTMTTKLQIPIDQDVREGLERRARSLGFDSAQAYIRVWAKAEADGRKLDFDGKAVVLSPEANARYEQMLAELEADKKSGKVDERFVDVKPIIRHRKFIKNFQSRISPDQKLKKQFEARLQLFTEGVRDYPLDDHTLVGTMKGLRAFSVGGDLRVVYRETDEYYEFLDVGSHNQVY